jgi:hypothetical protein
MYFGSFQSHGFYLDRDGTTDDPRARPDWVNPDRAASNPKAIQGIRDRAGIEFDKTIYEIILSHRILTLHFQLESLIGFSDKTSSLSLSDSRSVIARIIHITSRHHRPGTARP